MKTTDLIPLILYELKDSDKYGFELTKAIETKSKSRIVIKQPTLYTVLKKLEKSKFITSYWQDSDIGGKRHYYKITDNGKAQLAVLPSYEELINTTLQSDESDFDLQLDMPNQEFVSPANDVDDSMDVEIEEKIDLATIENTIPTQEVFATDSIDKSTEIDINTSNVELLKDEAEQSANLFSNNEDVCKFTDKVTQLSDEDKQQILATDFVDTDKYVLKQNYEYNFSNIKSKEYVDLKFNPNFIRAKKQTNLLLTRTILTSFYLMLMLILSAIGVIHHGSSALFVTYFIISVCALLIYPIVVFNNKDKYTIVCYKENHKTNMIRALYTVLAILAVVVISCVIYCAINKCALFELSNFANFYAEIIIASTLLFDFILKFLFNNPSRRNNATNIGNQKFNKNIWQ